MEWDFSNPDPNLVEQLWDLGVPFMSARQTQSCFLTCNKCWNSVTRLGTRRGGVRLLWLCLVLLHTKAPVYQMKNFPKCFMSLNHNNPAHLKLLGIGRPNVGAIHIL